MSNVPTTAQQDVILDQKETDALNRHGLFFKKKVLDEVRKIPALTKVSEELGVRFGETRVIDIVARDSRATGNPWYIFECKRAYASEKRWFFLEDSKQEFRLYRERKGMAITGAYSNVRKIPITVCSDGYEFNKSDSNANQNPVFRAASQLSSGFLGLIQRRAVETQFDAAPPERYIPILVTTAELALVEYDITKVGLTDGKLAQNTRFSIKPYLVLQHPFPAPEGVTDDPRDRVRAPIEWWYHHHKESVYIVTSSALTDFIQKFRQWIDPYTLGI